VQAIGFDHVVLAVSDLDKSAAHYRKFFDMEASHSNTRISFAVAKTRLILEPAKPAGIVRIGVRVAGFDKRLVTERLQALKVEAVPADDRNAIRFKDLNGIVMELRA